MVLKTNPALIATIALAVVLCFGSLVGNLAAAAQATTPTVTTSYNVNAAMGSNLKALSGKRVYVTLTSGVVFTGVVKNVGEHLVHIEKLEGKEFFDALIRIDSIEAIDTRFRTQ